MFTVKHRDESGVERLYSAATVECINAGDRFQDGIYLDRTPEGAAHIILFPDRTQPAIIPDRPGVVFVMNTNGATVARYEV